MEYAELGWEAFNALPPDDRLTYVDYRIQEGLEEHADLLNSRGKPAYLEPSEASTPQEIADHFVYVLDDAHLRFDVSVEGEKSHDPIEAIKLLSAAFLKVEGDGLSEILENEVERSLAEDFGAPFADDTQFTATGSVSKSGV